MIENNSENFSGQCPVRRLLDRIGDRWSILVISMLGELGTQRFGELKQNLGSVSQKMLTITLKNLEADGLILRKMYAQIPPRVEYTLSDLGKTLLPTIESLVKWATDSIPEVLEARERYKNKEV